MAEFQKQVSELRPLYRQALPVRAPAKHHGLRACPGHEAGIRVDRRHIALQRPRSASRRQSRHRAQLPRRRALTRRVSQSASAYSSSSCVENASLSALPTDGAVTNPAVQHPVREREPETQQDQDGGKWMAPRAGLEPATRRLTVGAMALISNGDVTAKHRFRAPHLTADFLRLSRLSAFRSLGRHAPSPTRGAPLSTLGCPPRTRSAGPLPPPRVATHMRGPDRMVL
jgi:hypothetical protein